MAYKVYAMYQDKFFCSFPVDLPMGNCKLYKILDTVKYFKNKRGF